MLSVGQVTVKRSAEGLEPLPSEGSGRCQWWRRLSIGVSGGGVKDWILA
jgi:hypothetical protein